MGQAFKHMTLGGLSLFKPLQSLPMAFKLPTSYLIIETLVCDVSVKIKVIIRDLQVTGEVRGQLMGKIFPVGADTLCR